MRCVCENVSILCIYIFRLSLFYSWIYSYNFDMFAKSKYSPHSLERELSEFHGSKRSGFDTCMLKSTSWKGNGASEFFLKAELVGPPARINICWNNCAGFGASFQQETSQSRKKLQDRAVEKCVGGKKGGGVQRGFPWKEWSWATTFCVHLCRRII